MERAWDSPRCCRCSPPARSFIYHNFMNPLMRLVLGIGPFSGILGFVTPMLVDRWSGGDPVLPAALMR